MRFIYFSKNTTNQDEHFGTSFMKKYCDYHRVQGWNKNYKKYKIITKRCFSIFKTPTGLFYILKSSTNYGEQNLFRKFGGECHFLRYRDRSSLHATLCSIPYNFFKTILYRPSIRCFCASFYCESLNIRCTTSTLFFSIFWSF